MNTPKALSRTQAKRRTAHAVRVKPATWNWEHGFEDRLIKKVDDGVGVVSELIYLLSMEKSQHGKVSIKTRIKLVMKIQRLVELLSGIPNKLDHASK